MKLLNRYETIGIILSIVAVLLVLGAIRFFQLPQGEAKETASTSESDTVWVDPTAENKDGALREAILDASDNHGNITKLIVNDISVGTGREVKVGDTVTVHYIGLLKDGPEFDNSYKKNKAFSFKVGAGQVVEGWDKGIIGMKEGGKRILVVPPSLGYGNKVVDPLPAGATLVFSLELISIE